MANYSTTLTLSDANSGGTVISQNLVPGDVLTVTVQSTAGYTGSVSVSLLTGNVLISPTVVAFGSSFTITALSGGDGPYSVFLYYYNVSGPESGGVNGQVGATLTAYYNGSPTRSPHDQFTDGVRSHTATWYVETGGLEHKFYEDTNLLRTITVANAGNQSLPIKDSNAVNGTQTSNSININNGQATVPYNVIYCIEPSYITPSDFTMDYSATSFNVTAPFPVAAGDEAYSITLATLPLTSTTSEVFTARVAGPVASTGIGNTGTWALTTFPGPNENDELNLRFWSYRYGDNSSNGVERYGERKYYPAASTFKVIRGPAPAPNVVSDFTPALASYTEGSGTQTVTLSFTIGNPSQSTYYWKIIGDQGANQEFTVDPPQGSISYPTNTTFSVTLSNNSVDETGFQGETFYGELFTDSARTQSIGTSSSFTVYDNDLAFAIGTISPSSTLAATYAGAVTVDVTNNGESGLQPNSRIYNVTKAEAAYEIVDLPASGGTETYTLVSLPDPGTTNSYRLDVYNGTTLVAGPTFTISRSNYDTTPSFDLGSNAENVPFNGYIYRNFPVANVDAGQDITFTGSGTANTKVSVDNVTFATSITRQLGQTVYVRAQGGSSYGAITTATVTSGSFSDSFTLKNITLCPTTNTTDSVTFTAGSQETLTGQTAVTSGNQLTITVNTPYDFVDEMPTGAGNKSTLFASATAGTVSITQPSGGVGYVVYTPPPTGTQLSETITITHQEAVAQYNSQDFLWDWQVVVPNDTYTLSTEVCAGVLTAPGTPTGVQTGSDDLQTASIQMSVTNPGSGGTLQFFFSTSNTTPTITQAASGSPDGTSYSSGWVVPTAGTTSYYYTFSGLKRGRTYYMWAQVVSGSNREISSVGSKYANYVAAKLFGGITQSAIYLESNQAAYNIFLAGLVTGQEYEVRRGSTVLLAWDTAANLSGSQVITDIATGVHTLYTRRTVAYGGDPALPEVVDDTYTVYNSLTVTFSSTEVVPQSGTITFNFSATPAPGLEQPKIDPTPSTVPPTYTYTIKDSGGTVVATVVNEKDPEILSADSGSTTITGPSSGGTYTYTLDVNLTYDTDTGGTASYDSDTLSDSTIVYTPATAPTSVSFTPGTTADELTSITATAIGGANGTIQVSDNNNNWYNSPKTFAATASVYARGTTYTFYARTVGTYNTANLSPNPTYTVPYLAPDKAINTINDVSLTGTDSSDVSLSIINGSSTTTYAVFNQGVTVQDGNEIDTVVGAGTGTATLTIPFAQLPGSSSFKNYYLYGKRATTTGGSGLYEALNSPNNIVVVTRGEVNIISDFLPEFDSYTEDSGTQTINFSFTIQEASQATYYWKLIRVSGTNETEFSVSQGTTTAANPTFSATIASNTTDETGSQGEVFYARIYTDSGRTVQVGPDSGQFTLYDNDLAFAIGTVSTPISAAATTATVQVTNNGQGGLQPNSRIYNVTKAEAAYEIVDLPAAGGTETYTLVSVPDAGTTNTYRLEVWNGNELLPGPTFTVTKESAVTAPTSIAFTDNGNAGPSASIQVIADGGTNGTMVVSDDNTNWVANSSFFTKNRSLTPYTFYARTEGLVTNSESINDTYLLDFLDPESTPTIASNDIQVSGSTTTKAIAVTGILEDETIRITSSNVSGGPWTATAAGNATITVACPAVASTGNYTIEYKRGTTSGGDGTTWTSSGVTFTITRSAFDIFPGNFTYDPIGPVTAGSLQTSNAWVISSIDTDVDISVSAGGEYKINNGSWTSTAASAAVSSGDSIFVRGDSSAAAGGVVYYTVTVGTGVGTLEITTEGTVSETGYGFQVFDSNGVLKVSYNSTIAAIAATDTLTIPSGQSEVVSVPGIEDSNDWFVTTAGKLVNPSTGNDVLIGAQGSYTISTNEITFLNNSGTTNDWVVTYWVLRVG